MTFMQFNASFYAADYRIQKKDIDSFFNASGKKPFSKAQKNNNLAEFKLIICDESHRTTGATFDDEDDSKFTNNGTEYIHKQLKSTG